MIHRLLFIFILASCKPLAAEWWNKPDEYKGEEVRIMFRGAVKPFSFDNSMRKDGFVVYELIHPTVGVYAYHTFIKAPVEYCYVPQGKVSEFEKLYHPTDTARCMPLINERKSGKHEQVRDLDGELVYCFKDKRAFYSVLWKMNGKYVLIYK